MMPLCLTLTNGMVHHAALLRPGTCPAPMAPRMFDLGKSTGGVKGRSHQAGGSSKSAISGDSPFSPAVSQVQLLRDLPGSPVAALKYLSSSVTYRGSRGDLADVRRLYVEYPSLVHDKARVIYGRENLYRSAKMGAWTYPGWRVDVSAALRSIPQRPKSKSTLISALEKLDRKQELDDALAHGVLSTAATSLKSYFFGIGITWIPIYWAFLLTGIGDELSGALLICALANSYVY